MKKVLIAVGGLVVAGIMVFVGVIYSRSSSKEATTDIFEESVYYYEDKASSEDNIVLETQDYAPAEVITVTDAPETVDHSFETASSDSKGNTQDMPVDESNYSEAREYSAELLDLQNRISAAMGPEKELSFVTSSMILENPDRLHVVLNTEDENAISLLKSFNTKGVNLEIEYSTSAGVEE